MRKPISDISRSVSVESEKEIEVFPGRFERRYFLRGSVAAAATLVAAGTLSRSVFAQTAITATALSGSDKLAWDDFLKQSIPVAQQLLADPAFSIDEYLYRIGSLATRLKELPDSALLQDCRSAGVVWAELQRLAFFHYSVADGTGRFAPPT